MIFFRFIWVQKNYKEMKKSYKDIELPAAIPDKIRGQKAQTIDRKSLHQAEIKITKTTTDKKQDKKDKVSVHHEIRKSAVQVANKPQISKGTVTCQSKVTAQPPSPIKLEKGKLKRASNAKTKPKQQPNPVVQNANLLKQSQMQSHEPFPLISPKPLKQTTNKIKQNQQKILNVTRMLTNSRTCEELLKNVPLSSAQNDRLRLYFKYLCELIPSYPKRNTFEDVKNMFETINMTEWMIFCKYMGITEKFKKKSDGIHLLSFLFKKYQDHERRMSFDKFLFAVREVVLEISATMKEENKQNERQKKELSENEQNNIKNVLDWLNLNDKKKHKQKLKQMGIMCSEEAYQMPKLGSPPKTQRKTLQTSSQNPIRTSLPNSNSSSFHVNSTVPTSPVHTKLPKIYLTNLERKQSKLMHSLAITNLNKVTPSDDTKQFLEKYIGYDDRYLKQYFNKQDSVKRGVIGKLEAKGTGNTNSNNRTITYNKSRVRML